MCICLCVFIFYVHGICMCAYVVSHDDVCVLMLQENAVFVSIALHWIPHWYWSWAIVLFTLLTAVRLMVHVFACSFLPMVLQIWTQDLMCSSKIYKGNIPGPGKKALKEPRNIWTTEKDPWPWGTCSVYFNSCSFLTIPKEDTYCLLTKNFKSKATVGTAQTISCLFPQ